MTTRFEIDGRIYDTEQMLLVHGPEPAWLRAGSRIDLVGVYVDQVGQSFVLEDSHHYRQDGTEAEVGLVLTRCGAALTRTLVERFGLPAILLESSGRDET